MPEVGVSITPHLCLLKPQSTKMPATQFRCVMFTINNPEGVPMYDGETMEYLLYQEEIGAEGTYHLQGYCEFTSRKTMNQAKALLGGVNVHIEARRGTQQQAIDYCKKEDSRVPHTSPYEYGQPKTQGKRNDLKDFKDLVMSGTKRKRDLIEDHYGTLARYPKFYDTLIMNNRPTRTTELEVILHYGGTGLGKTRTVMDLHQDDQDFYIAPLSNGTTWFDTYDGHRTVLLDDFAGAASHTTLVSLLRLLDRYPVLVPTKGSHTWWLPDRIYITTNILPKDWYKWENRGEQYKALARRIHKVKTFWDPLFENDVGYQWEDEDWWKVNAPAEAIY